jgi:putative peptidoglycan lipid II flippase
LRTAGKLAVWVLIFVVTSQLSYTVVTRLASASVAFTTYFNAYQLFQLPYAIITVSVITALLPRMSGHAADGRLSLVRDDLSTGLRTTVVILIPAAFGLFVLAQPLAVALFGHGAVSVSDAQRIGSALAGFAVALLPFSCFQLQLRAFYAMADSRTPALVNFVVAGINICAALALSALIPDRQRAVALALAFATAYTVGAVVCLGLLRRRLSGVDGARVLQTAVRVAVASVPAAVLTAVIAHLVRSALGHGTIGSLATVVFAGVAGAALFLALALRMRVRELSALADIVRSRLGRG